MSAAHEEQSKWQAPFQHSLSSLRRNWLDYLSWRLEMFHPFPTQHRSHNVLPRLLPRPKYSYHRPALLCRPRFVRLPELSQTLTITISGYWCPTPLLPASSSVLCTHSGTAYLACALPPVRSHGARSWPNVPTRTRNLGFPVMVSVAVRRETGVLKHMIGGV